MVNCPCGYGKDIPSTQTNCHICGMDLTVLHLLEQFPARLVEKGREEKEKGDYEKALSCILAAECLDRNFNAGQEREWLLKAVNRKSKRALTTVHIAVICLLLAAGCLWYASYPGKQSNSRPMETNHSTIAKREPSLKTEQRGFHYRIRKGDSLSRLALMFYGNSSYWGKIYENNKDVLADPAQLQVGQIIFVPDLQRDQKGGSWH